jgi:triacylglycerol esterase/lipase EstA (alpha/beta hydrolase family)
MIKIKSPSSKIFNKKLNSKSIKSPVIITFNLNWKQYQYFKLEQYQHIKDSFEKNNINAELLPILIDSRTDLDERMKQFSNEISKFCDIYNSKVHVVSYSLASLAARSFIYLSNGEDYIKTITTVGSPNK